MSPVTLERRPTISRPAESRSAGARPAAAHPADARPADNGPIAVLEVDQWTATGNVEDFRLCDFPAAAKQIQGGPTLETIRIIGIDHVVVKTVRETDFPAPGRVWFREAADGKLTKWRGRYDSSD
jgi:hypothetical protein